ncbi:MAG: kelch repeat-containing protein, partial [Sulfolobaceae archaeon]
MKRVILLLVLTLVFSQVAYSAVGFNYNEIEELPYPIRDAGSTVLNGKLYVIGGISSNNNILNSTIIIDLKTLKWTFGPSLPIPLYAPLVITYNNTIYVIGGVTVNNTINKYVLKLVGNYWSIVSTLPTPVYYAIGFGWNDKIYVIGGFTKLSSGVGIIGGAVSMTDLVQIYDLRSGSWTTSNAPIKVAEAGYTFNGTHLIIVGGYVGLAQFSSSVYIYNPSTNNWTELPSLPVDIFSEAVAYYHKVILVVEGISSSIYEPIGGNFKVYAFYEGKWYVIGNVSESFYSFAYSQDGNTLYIIGGINWATSQISDKILTFKILTPPLQPIIQQVRIMNHSVYLSWSCQNASYYKVEYWSENGNLSSIITTQNFTVISNLSNGIRYYFRIIPYNQFGEGDPSNIVSAVPGTVPLPPKIISIIPGNQNLTINWSPTSDEGYPIIGYYLGISENESKNIRWFYVGNVTSYTVTNLTAGNKYIIYLIA